MTRRFALAQLPGLALAVAGAFDPAWFLLALAWHGIWILLALADGLLGGDDGLAVRREVAERLSLGDPARVKLRLENRTGRRIDADVYDSPPGAFEADPAWTGARLPPGTGLDGGYEIIPLERGRFRFGDLWIRATCRLGLARRRRRIPAGTDVLVVPNLEGIRRADLLARRSRLAQAGIHRVRFAGQGTEFEQLRDYTADDDYRRINWKATAKRSRPVTVDYQVERAQNILLCVDTSYRMETPEGRLTRLDCAVNAAALLAHAGLSGGDRVGAVAFADRVVAAVPGQGGIRHLQRISEGLNALRAEPTRADFRELARHLAVTEKRRSLLAIFTDLSGESEGEDLLACVKLLRVRHLPLVLTFPDSHLEEVLAARPEKDRDAFRQAVACELSRRRAGTIRDLRRRGAHVVEAPAAELSVQAVNAYMGIKARQLL